MEPTRSQDRGVPRAGTASLIRAAALTGRTAGQLASASANWHRLMIAAGLIAPLLLLYRAVLFGGAPWLDFDLLLSYQPRYRLLAEGLADGRIPLWTHELLGGFPVAFSEFGWFYPLTWGLLRIFDPLHAYFIETAIGLVMTAAAAYGLGRVWGLSRRSAFVAAFIFTYSPFVFATSRFLNYADIFFVLPAGLIAIERIAQGRTRWVVSIAVITGIASLAGHPQVALMFVSVWLLYALFRLEWTRQARGLPACVRLGSWIVIGVVIGLALGAVRLLPTIETTALSARAGGLSFETAAQGSIAPWSLILGYLHPSFEIPRVLDETLNAEELLYLGFMTPLLALLAILVARRHRVVRFLAVLVVVSWILAMGSYSLGFPLVHKLPLFGFFRQPARFGIVASFGIAFLAGYGFDLLLRPEVAKSRPIEWLARIWTGVAGVITAGTLMATVVLSGFAFLIVPYGYDLIDRTIVGSEGRFLTADRYYRTFDQLYARLEHALSLVGATPRLMLVVAIAGAVLVWGYRRGALRGTHAQIGFGALITADLLLAPGHAIATVPDEWYKRPASELAGPVVDRAGRLFSYRAQAQKFELSTATGDQLSQEQRDLLEWIFLTATHAPNLALDDGPGTVDGYENLMPSTTAALLAYGGSERATVEGFATDPLLDAHARLDTLRSRLGVLAAINVRYITSGTALTIDGLREIHADLIELPRWVDVEQPLFVYEIENWRPDLWVARNWEVVDASDDVDVILDQLARQPDVPLVETDPGINRAQMPSLPDALGPVTRGPERIEFSVTLEAPGLVILNEAPSPGWTAEVNGKPTNVLSVNLMARGVALPAGAHHIMMRFDPPGHAFGIVVSLVATGLLFPLLIAGLWSERQ